MVSPGEVFRGLITVEWAIEDGILPIRSKKGGIILIPYMLVHLHNGSGCLMNEYLCQN